MEPSLGYMPGLRGEGRCAQSRSYNSCGVESGGFWFRIEGIAIFAWGFHENLVVIDTERKWTIKANAEESSVKILKPIVVCSKGCSYIM